MLPTAMIHVKQCPILAMFTWNPLKTSLKLALNEDNLRCSSIDGSGFKTTLGTEIFTEGGRYYF